MQFRNLLFDRGWRTVTLPPVKTIAVGNLTVGGTGKTPMVEFLIRLFRDTNRLAVLSRGYGRKTRGVILADTAATARTLGDEPLQYYRKFGGTTAVVVAEKRVEGMETLLRTTPGIDLLLLDDAYQHRAIGRHVNLLLSDYSRPFYTDYPFPGGDLRERRQGARRADVIVVTKCPRLLPAHEQTRIRQRIQVYSRPQVPVFFTRMRYGNPAGFIEGISTEGFSQFVCLSGIAGNSVFEAYVRQHYRVSHVCHFPDHHAYSLNELTAAIAERAETTALLTTEKDMVKLLPLAREAGIAQRCFYIPVQIDFEEDEAGFRDILLKLLARQ